METYRMEITGEELLKRYISGERDFSVMIIESCMRENFFQGADLSGINLERAALNVDFSGAVMRNSNLRYSIWGGHCSWKNVNFTGSDFTGVNNNVECVFTRCNFSDTIWDEAELWQSTFKDCITRRARFSKASLAEVDFE